MKLYIQPLAIITHQPMRVSPLGTSAPQAPVINDELPEGNPDWKPVQLSKENAWTTWEEED